MENIHITYCTTTTTVLQPFVQDYPGELVPEGQIILNFAEADMMGWQWQAVCTSLQKITMLAAHQSDFCGLDAPFPTPNQQRQSTEGQYNILHNIAFNIKYTLSRRKYNQLPCKWGVSLKSTLQRDHYSGIQPTEKLKNLTLRPMNLTFNPW